MSTQENYNNYKKQAAFISSITYEELISDSLFEVLTSVFDEAQTAFVLLERIGFPNGKRPQFTTSIEFWRNVCREIDKGLINNGFERLFHQAALMYPMNRAFQFAGNQAISKRAKNANYSNDHLKSSIKVFLSYNSKDTYAVQKVGETLLSEGITPWFDKWEEKAGRIHDMIERGLNSAHIILIFLSPNGNGPWQDHEIGIAINLYVTRGIRIIPVFLEGYLMENAPLFLHPFKAVSIVDVKDEKSLAELIKLVKS